MSHKGDRLPGPATRQIRERHDEATALLHAVPDDRPAQALGDAIMYLWETMFVLAGHVDAIRIQLGLDPDDDLRVGLGTPLHAVEDDGSAGG